MPTRFSSALCFAACTCLHAPLVFAQAAPACAITGAPSLKGRVRGAATPLSAAVDAKSGQELDVFLLWPGTLNGKKVVFSEDEGDGRVSWTKNSCPSLEISWQRIEPRMAHLNTPAPNPGLRVYANAVIFGPRHGKWLGYDRLEFIESPIPQAAGPSLTLRDARPANFVAPRPADHEGLGVMRLAASVRLGAATWKTAGIEDAAVAQIPPRVFRYSFRAGDGFIGWLTAFYNVPYLFGSAGDGARNQADLFIGADCADVLVAALRRAGLPRMHYTNVGGVMDQLTRLKHEAVVRPCPPEQPACASTSDPPLRFGTDVRPGDILAVDYLGAGELPRALDHIVVLVSDSGPQGVPDGVLGPHDLVFDSGDERALKLAPLSDQGAVRVVVSRPAVAAF